MGSDLTILAPKKERLPVMGIPHACLSLWIDAGRAAQGWARPLEATRRAIKAEAVGFASRAGDHEPWRLVSVGPAAADLEAAYFDAHAHPQAPHGDLCLAPVEEDGRAYLVSWRARANMPADLGLHAQAMAAALIVRRQIERADTDAQGRSALVEALPFSAALVERDLRARVLNGSAVRLLARDDGLSLRQGRLVCARAEDNEALRACIDQALSPRTGAGAPCMRIARTKLDTPYAAAALASPLKDACLLIIVDEANSNTTLWRALLDLDLGELNLARAILSGERRN